MTRKITLLFTFFLIFSAFAANAQVKNVQKEAERQGTNRINRKIDKGIDGGLDKIEEGIGSLFGKKKKKNNNDDESEKETKSGNQQQAPSNNSGISVAGQDPDALFQQYGMFPSDGATDVPIPLTFKWTPMNSSDFKAKRYEVYLYTEGYADDMLISNTTDTKKTYSKLEPNTTYTWSVKGQSASGQWMPGPGGTFTTGNGEAAAPKMDVQWSKFDFVPGDEVIFEDGPNIMEENGEFPSRWDLVGGVVEIANVNNENVIMFREGEYSNGIIPYLKNSKEDYLPEVFTIEFDCFYTKGYSGRYYVSFYDRKNQKYAGEQLDIYVNSMELGESEQSYPGKQRGNHDETGGWRHISIAFTNGKMKCYMNDTRLINIPHFEGNPTGLTLAASVGSNDDVKKFIKNIRIAKGGVKYYDRVLNEGKIVCNGIRFDVNKATLKPESMGPINNIFELMQKQPDLKFSVEGHTDSDGDETKNQTLSEQRAKAVLDQLISMGISADRLTSNGFGESQPIVDNGTAEGKANNRRVEFVKF